MEHHDVTADVPGDDVVVPDVVRKLAGDAGVEPVWRNELGGLTFRLRGFSTGVPDRFAKWQPLEGLTDGQLVDVDLEAEAERLLWASGRVPVPAVVEYGHDRQAAWLVTEALDGIAAYDPRWRGTPEVAVRAIAEGLRTLHEAASVDECPFIDSWPSGPDGSSGFDRLPEPDKLVVCHGDACVPNTLIDGSGRFAGLVDLGRLGVADRWADLAIATYSISWDVNFGRSYDDLFFETYGVEPDEERMRFYRDLWDS